ncbi:MAG: hypothetical protein WD826_08695 [Actinomycetota bacterium]
MRIGWASTDAVSEVVNVANPEVGSMSMVEPELLAPQGERFYPMLEKLARCMQTIAGEYVIEGTEFLPRHADRLRALLPVRACFLGWSEVTIESIDLHGGSDDWTKGMEEAFRATLPGRLVEVSKLHQRECVSLGVPYVDMAGDFSDKLERAYEILTSTNEG